MEQTHEMAIMRHMAWERAKGELRSMLHTYYGEIDRYDEMQTEIENFINRVEEDGLHE